MTVRQGRAAPRQSAQQPAVYKSVSIPPPTLGIIANSNLTAPPPGGAFILENYLPTATGARLRRGSDLYTEVGDLSDPVLSLFTYVNGNNQSQFAATADAIYDATTSNPAQFLTDENDVPLTDDQGNEFQIGFAAAEALVDTLTSGKWSVVQFATPGGVFLRCVNGADTPLVYDGADWDTSPAITGNDDDALDPTTLSYTWVHQQREFFIQKDTLDVWYLPAASIGGSATKLPLGGVFSLGGSLLFGSTWSLETGTGGLSEQCVFITTEGEVAVYQGTDPSTAETWSKVGIYRIGKPLGPNAHFRAGGDIVIATNIGLIPLSQALQKDFAVLSPSAVSASLETIWNEEVKNRSGSDWTCIVWSENQLAVVAPPTVTGQPPVMYVANTRTGAWGKITGWDANCLSIFQGRMFFGSVLGRVVEANVTGLDQGSPYTATYVPLFSDLGVPGEKTIGLSRLVVQAFAEPKERLSMQKDYQVSLPPPPDAAVISGSNAWGVGKWGEAVWGASFQKKTYQTWRSTPLNGNAVATAAQITSGSIVPLDADIVRTDVTFMQAEMVV